MKNIHKSFKANTLFFNNIHYIVQIIHMFCTYVSCSPLLTLGHKNNYIGLFNKHMFHK